nr:PD40 domain-containing protein [Bacteroidota bacterium]
MNADGENQTGLTTNPAMDTGPDWSPDGSMIAFTSFRDGNFEIYTMTSEGSDQQRLTYTDVHAFHPAWRPEINIGINEQNDEGTSMKSAFLQVFPNPSKSIVTIKYSLVTSNHTTLTINDSSGKLIKTLLDSNQQEGKHEIIWDGSDNSGNAVKPGVYYSTIQAGSTNQSIKIIKINNP